MKEMAEDLFKPPLICGIIELSTRPLPPSAANPDQMTDTTGDRRLAAHHPPTMSTHSESAESPHTKKENAQCQ